MSVSLPVFAESDEEVKVLEEMARETTEQLYRKGYVVSSDTYIRLLHKISANPLLMKLL